MLICIFPISKTFELRDCARAIIRGIRDEASFAPKGIFLLQILMFQIMCVLTLQDTGIYNTNDDAFNHNHHAIISSLYLLVSPSRKPRVPLSRNFRLTYARERGARYFAKRKLAELLRRRVTFVAKSHRFRPHKCFSNYVQERPPQVHYMPR